jgi:peptidyl-prolyl cis-trans isomerase C
MGSLFGRGHKVACSHILVSKREKALELAEQLTGGADFAQLAREHSTCPSRADGGKLGTFGRGQMVKEFDSVAFGLEVGQTSEPVQTKFGWHLIKRTA